MHSVNQPQPITFQTRWTMSYLAGPLTLEQIKRLKSQSPSSAVETTSSSATTPAPKTAPSSSASSRPILPPEVKQYFVPPTQTDAIIYYPQVLGSVEARVQSTKYRVDSAQIVQRLAEIGDGPVPINWDDATEINLELSRLQGDPHGVAEFADLSGQLSGKALDKWGKEYAKWVAQNQGLTLYQSAVRKLTSNPGESEGDFRIRISQAAREARDELAEKLKTKYTPKITALEEKIRKAQQTVAAQKAQAQQAQLSTALNVGMGLLGALLGGRTSSAVSKAGRAIGQAGRAYSEGQDVARAGDTVEAYSAQLQDLQTQLQSELEGITGVDVEEKLEEITVKPKATDVTLQIIALAWVPYRRDEAGRLNPAWE
jgi:hypothetical protein